VVAPVDTQLRQVERSAAAYSPAGWVDPKGLERVFQRVLKTLSLSAMGTRSMLEFAIEDLLWQPLLWHANDMASQTKL
jgi:hypothetical protein